MFTSKKSMKLIFFLILIVYLLFLFFKSSYVVNGNNKKNIVKTIQSIDGYESNESIEILKIIDSKNDRIVAFLYNNSPAYIQFNKDNLGNFKWTHLEKKTGESLSIINVNPSIDTIRILVITNNDNNIAKMKMNVNGKKLIEDEISVGQKSASFFEIDNLPESIDHGYEYSYEFLDKDGKAILEEN